MSIIEEGFEKQVRMAHLAIVGSHAVNGVSALHSELLRSTLVPEFAQLWPEKFSNKTNGVAPRRWLLKANPQLSRLLCETIGDEWITDLEELAQAGAICGLRRIPAALCRGEVQQQAAARQGHPRNRRACSSIRPRCSTCRSSASTNTSANC